jgi:TonB family protein
MRIIAAMMRTTLQSAGVFLLVCGICAAQTPTAAVPDDVVIGRHTFIDVGPPFDFYEVIRVKSEGDDLAVERALVTPLGPTCGPLATVEVAGGTLPGTMSELLGGKNPCAIPEKDLHRELKRCKHCLTFSGVNVAMQVSCGGNLRQLRMDILDRDLFDSAPHTPENTSWTMGMLGRLDKVLGPGVWDKPMFAVGDAAAKPGPDSELVQTIRDGTYDALFGKGQLVSQIAKDAAKAPPPPPSVEIESVVPIGPISPKMPIYPPIAKAARVEGVVNVTFDISPEGRVVNIAVVDGPKMLQLSVTDGLSGWNFPPSAWGSSGRASIRFQRNCAAGPS